MDEQEWWTTTDVETMLAFMASRNAPPGAVVPQASVSERKLRLFLAGCCRRHWEHFDDQACRAAVEVVERLADGLADEAERAEAEQNAEAAHTRAMEAALAQGGPKDRALKVVAFLTTGTAVAICRPYDWLTHEHLYCGRSPGDVPMHPRSRYIRAGGVPHQMVRVVEYHRAGTGSDEGRPLRSALDAEEAAQADLFRCIVGPLPFRHVFLPPSLRTWNNGLLQHLAGAAYEHRLLPSGHLDSQRLAVLADALEEAGADELVEHLRGAGPHPRGCWPVDIILSRE
jgi:hypothetical protein